MYGHFSPLTESIPHAVAVDIGAAGINGQGTTLTSVLNEALADKDLLAGIRGQTFSGHGPVGATWKFKVSNTHYARAAVGLNPRDGGANVSATVRNVVVTGTLSIHALFLSVSHTVTMTMDAATVAGALNVSVNEETGVLNATMPQPTTRIAGFRYDSNNLGLPCCVDTAITHFLAPRVQSAFREGVREKVASTMKVSLASLHLPGELQLPAGMPAVALESKFDGGQFEAKGARITASMRFGKPFEPTELGAKAPGWLHLDGALADATYQSPYGVSVSLDAINQLLFAVWGTGAFARDVPDSAPITQIHVDAAFPPVVVPGEGNTLKIALGELKVRAALQGKPFTVAVSIVQDVVPTVTKQALVLTPKGAPTVSITWLDAHDMPDSTKSFLGATAQDQLAKAIKPVRIPLPKMDVGRVASAFAGQSLAVVSPTLDLAPDQNRISLAGKLALVK